MDSIRHQGIFEGASTRFFRGVACQRDGKSGQSIEHYNKATQAKPDLSEAYYNRGNAYKDMGNHARAIEDYCKAICLKPDYAEAYNDRRSRLRWSKAILPVQLKTLTTR